MAQYIDKAKVVEEIKKRIKENEEHWKSHGGIETATGRGVLIGYRDILYFLDTLEVEEVDLEKEIHSWMEDNTCRGYCSASIRDTAEHFFELGLKAQKGE